MLLDTLRMRRRLLEAGFPDQQADALTEEIANIVTGELATKADLREQQSETGVRFAEVRSEIADVRNELVALKGEIAEVRGEIAGVRNELGDLRVSIADFKTSFAKWGVGLAVAVLLGFAGMSVAIVLSLARIAG